MNNDSPVKTGTQFMNIDDYITPYPDFPKQGILFRDICPLLASPDAMRFVIDQFYDALKPFEPDGFAGIESRGFLFSTLLAEKFGVGSYILRKPGKLPGSLMTESYALEYGQNELTIQSNTPIKGKRIVLVDDLLATGGTVKASKKLLHRLGATPVALAVVIELTGLKGRDVIDLPLITLTSYD
jgi:adenine phosphoribosyltransferase